MTRKPKPHSRRNLRVLSSGEVHQRPEYLDWTQAQKDAAGGAVLVRAFHLLVREGWLPPSSLAQLGNTARRPGWTLIEAVMACGTEPGVDAWYARRLLDRVEYPLPQWEAHPYRTQECVLQLIRRALRACGLEAPSMPRPVHERRRGGWRVSSGRAA